MYKMKELILSAVVLMFLAVSAWAGINDGLVAYYPFNGNANDESGNGNNGTVNGATLTTDRFGNANSAYSFNGVSDYIDLGRFFPGGTNIFSFSIWFKNNNDTSWTLMGAQSCGGNGLVLDYNLHAADSFMMTKMFISGTNVSAPWTWDNNWHHVVFSSSSSGEAIYLDGLLIGSHSENRGIRNSAVHTYVGARNVLGCSYGAQDFFGGIIDDIRIYNRALSGTEIQEFMIGDLKGIIGTLNLPATIAVSLDDKLNAAIAVLEDEDPSNDGAAINILKAFIKSVKAQKGKNISIADADSLISQVNAIISNL